MPFSLSRLSTSPAQGLSPRLHKPSVLSRPCPCCSASPRSCTLARYRSYTTGHSRPACNFCQQSGLPVVLLVACRPGLSPGKGAWPGWYPGGAPWMLTTPCKSKSWCRRPNPDQDLTRMEPNSSPKLLNPAGSAFLPFIP